MARKMTKKAAKAAVDKKPKFDRNWLTSPSNPDNCPYWTPPCMDVDLTYASLLYMDKKGTPIKDQFLYTGAKVKIKGEFSRLSIEDDGLVADLQSAIDEVIRKHTKLPKNSKPKMIAPKEKK